MKAAKTIFLLLWSLLVLIGGHASASFMRGAENRVWEIWADRLETHPGNELQAADRQCESSADRLKLTLGCVEVRYYDPRLGRWLSRDPMGESGGFNLYAYCGNDPVNRWDYLGMDYTPILTVPMLPNPDWWKVLHYVVAPFRVIKMLGFASDPVEGARNVEEGIGILTLGAPAIVRAGANPKEGDRLLHAVGEQFGTPEGLLGFGVNLLTARLIPEIGAGSSEFAPVKLKLGTEPRGAPASLKPGMSAGELATFISRLKAASAVGHGANFAGSEIATLMGPKTSYEAWIDEVIAKKGAPFQERSPLEVAELRLEFNKIERPAYLKAYALTEEAEALFSRAQIAQMREGLVPDGWLVHHMKPLFRMGTNDWSNFLLTTREFHLENFDAWHFYDFGKNPFFEGGEKLPSLGDF